MAVKVRPKAGIQAAPPGRQTDSGNALNCVLSKGTKIEGQFNSTESIRLDGIVTGNVYCEKKLVLGETGRVEGKIDAKDAVIMGHVVGELVVEEVLHLNSTANIEGDITAKRMTVEEGARYNGACKIG